MSESTSGGAGTASLGIGEILAILPHRFPFLLVDRVLESGEGKAHALKNVTINEPFFTGHFPSEPVMPGVLIIEALAQASFFAMRGKMAPGAIGYLVGVDAARFKRKVVHGDVLHLYASLDFLKMGVGKTTCRAEVDGQIAAEAKITFAVAK
jgi:3-hydroxyacyl-[acyl-carrier-protein] dehydratase